MLTAKQKIFTAFDAFYGPYRKRGEIALRIETKKESKRIALRQLQDGIELTGGITLKREAQQFALQIPGSAKLSTQSAFGWKTMWAGSQVGVTLPSIPVTLPDSKIVRIELGTETITLGLDEDRPSTVVASLKDVLNPRSFFRGLSNFVKSGAVHILIAALLGAFGNYITLPWTTTQVVEVKVDQEKEKPEQQPVPVLTDMNTDSDFGGRGMSQPAGQVAQSADAQKQKAENIASGISNLVAKMAKISIGNLGKVANANTHGIEHNAAVDSLRGQMGEQRRTDLKGNFQFLSRGSLGKFSQWDMYGERGRQFSSRDLDEVAEVFRQLQEQFRNCYESALLKFEDLSVTVQYEAEVQGSGHLGEPVFQTAGHSTPEGEAVLNSCLSKVLRQAKLNRNLSGVKIRNQFIFRS